jgi:acyl carrier protein
MNTSDIRQAVLAALAAIAPEVDLGQLDPAEDLRDALDLDSMDILRFATALSERLGVDVAERDYAQIASLDGCVSYLAARLA